MLTANFVREKYPFSVDINGSGTFSILLDGDNKGASLSEFNGTVESNTSIQVQAIPSDGWRFSRWIGLPSTSELLYPSDLVNTSSLIDYVPPGPNYLTAKFVRNTFSLEINSSKPFQGSAVGSGFYEFEKLWISTPPRRNTFSLKNGKVILPTSSTINSAENSLVVPSYNISIRPNFKPKIYTIKTFNTDALGEITVKCTYDDKESVNQIEYNATSEVILLFEPKNSYTHMLQMFIGQTPTEMKGFILALGLISIP